MPPLNEEKVRQIIRDELQELLASDRYIFHKTVQFLDGRNVQFGLTTGTKFGTATSQKIGFYNTTPVIQRTGSAQAAVTGTAGASYTSTEQGMINDLKTLANELRAALVALGFIKGSA